MFVVKLRKDWTQSVLKVQEEVLGFGWCFLQQLHGRVNANVYQNLLQQHAVPSLQASPNQSPIFMQDSAPHHTAKRIKQFLDAENIEIIKWPAQSPDLNLIKNLWKILGDKVMAKKPTIQSPNYGRYWKKSGPGCSMRNLWYPAAGTCTHRHKRGLEHQPFLERKCPFFLGSFF